MVIVGLTGSVAMGKSTAAAMLRRLRVPVHDADAAVRRLTAPGGRAVPLVAAACPSVVGDGIIDRQALGALVFADPAALARLEAILHPLVRAETRRFLMAQARRRARLVVLDIPLLFESGQDAECDLVMVVSAPAAIQRQRALARPGMSPARLAGILERQMPDREKRRRADCVIPTGLGRAESLRRIKAFVRIARSGRGCRWRPGAWQGANARNRPGHRNDRA